MQTKFGVSKTDLALLYEEKFLIEVSQDTMYQKDTVIMRIYIHACMYEEVQVPLWQNSVISPISTNLMVYHFNVQW